MPIAVTRTSDLPAPRAHVGTALARLALAGLLAAAVYVAAAWWPTHVLAGPHATTALLTGVLLAYIGAQAGNIPSALALMKPPREQAGGVLLGLALRFGVTVGLAIAAALSGWVPAKPTVLTVALAQMAILLVDVLGLLRLLRRAPGGAA